MASSSRSFQVVGSVGASSPGELAARNLDLASSYLAFASLCFRVDLKPPEPYLSHISSSSRSFQVSGFFDGSSMELLADLLASNSALAASYFSLASFSFRVERNPPEPYLSQMVSSSRSSHF